MSFHVPVITSSLSVFRSFPEPYWLGRGRRDACDSEASWVMVFRKSRLLACREGTRVVAPDVVSRISSCDSDAIVGEVEWIDKR